MNEKSKVLIEVTIPEAPYVFTYTSTLEDHGVMFEEGGLLNITLSETHRIVFARGFWESVEIKVVDEE